MNVDIWTTGGYIEYTVSNPKAEAREEEAIMMGIIIGVIVAIIGVFVIVGVAVHYKNKKKRKEAETIQPQEVIKPNIQSSKFCPNCGSTIVLGNSYCSNCGGVI